MPRGVYERKPRKAKETTVSEPTDPTEPTPPAAPEPEVNDGDICDACWPDGWPGDGYAAGCEHGTWVR